MRVGDCVRALPLPTPSQSDEKSLQSTVLRMLMLSLHPKLISIMQSTWDGA